jgi:hypothetical protein
VAKDILPELFTENLVHCRFLAVPVHWEKKCMLASICEHGLPALFLSLLQSRWLQPISFHVETVDKGGVQKGNMR